MQALAQHVPASLVAPASAKVHAIFVGWVDAGEAGGRPNPGEMVSGEMVSLGLDLLHGLVSILDDGNHRVLQTLTETYHLTTHHSPERVGSALRLTQPTSGPDEKRRAPHGRLSGGARGKRDKKRDAARTRLAREGIEGAGRPRPRRVAEKSLPAPAAALGAAVLLVALHVVLAGAMPSAGDALAEAARAPVGDLLDARRRGEARTGEARAVARQCEGRPQGRKRQQPSRGSQLDGSSQHLALLFIETTAQERMASPASVARPARTAQYAPTFLRPHSIATRCGLKPC